MALDLVYAMEVCACDRCTNNQDPPYCERAMRIHAELLGARADGARRATKYEVRLEAAAGEYMRVLWALEELPRRHDSLQFTMWKDGEVYAVPPDKVDCVLHYVRDETRKLAKEGYSVIRKLYEAWDRIEELEGELDVVRSTAEDIL